jgi:YegS/Rv2252/BmrU family lipid kinase
VSRGRPLVIINPRSGAGRTGAASAETRKILEERLGPVDFALTERPRHATDLARQAAIDRRPRVIAVGGDGSIHEVVSGLVSADVPVEERPVLGIVGQGTGGDFRKTLGIEHRLDRYLAAIEEGRTRAIDVGAFSYKDHQGTPANAYFVNILSVGLGGLVDRLVHETSSVVGGTASYFIASARGLLMSRLGRLRITLGLGDDERTFEVTSRQISICNGRYFGSGMKVAPMAELDDGIFEVVDMGSAGKLKFALGSSAIYDGSHLQSPDVKHHRADRVDIELLNQEVDDRFLLDVDGEPLGRLPIRVKVLRGALRVIVPG